MVLICDFSSVFSVTDYLSFLSVKLSLLKCGYSMTKIFSRQKHVPKVDQMTSSIYCIASAVGTQLLCAGGGVWVDMRVHMYSYHKEYKAQNQSKPV
jgi:hypothetical protein